VVNHLKELLRENVAAAPPDRLDLDHVVVAGRHRVRSRRAGLVGGVAALVAAVVVATTIGLQHATEHAGPAERPAPDAPTLHLSDAEHGQLGSDFRVLASHTNRNLDRDNGQYFDGVTDDGLILYRDGPRRNQLHPRLALMSPRTGEKDWLPDLGIAQTQFWPVKLGTDRLVLLSMREGGVRAQLVAHVFDRRTRQWRTLEWPSLPDVEQPRAVFGPDDRLYVFVPATMGRPPEGGWPTGPNGEADDADAKGDTYHLWSVSLTDSSDVHDERLVVGDLAFTDRSMVWTDSTNGHAGLVHVRDLSTGAEHSFDPHAGKRCNLLSFAATDDRVVLGQYCGTYRGEVRDDRVQILTSEGAQVVTLQDSGIESATPASSDLVTVTAFEGGARSGTYVYELGNNRFFRLSEAVSKFAMGGPTPPGQLLWSTPVNHRHGATQWLGKVVS
jgi:hypothetical protein